MRSMSDEEDNYIPSKKPRKEPNSPAHNFNSDGNEYEDLTEVGIQLVSTLSSAAEFSTKQSFLECAKEGKSKKEACHRGNGRGSRTEGKTKSQKKGEVSSNATAMRATNIC
jgi:hypothetical protein